jgi:tRNA(Ile)-lysidine synthase
VTSAAVADIIGAVAGFARDHLDDSDVCVGLSGGADSLALTAAAVRAGLQVRALIVDHRLQDGSAAVAEQAARTARELGAHPTVLPVDVEGSGGLEAAARRARYAALDGARNGCPVLLAHTLDDQAETVLLGLARGSGPRSIAGMRPWIPPYGRPLLAIRRSQTVAACADLGVAPHEDPHNADPRFTRVRLRTEVLPLLEDVLRGGVTESLGRTAAQLQQDIDVLEQLADADAAVIAGDQVHCTDLAGSPAAVRRRLLRRWLVARGATEPTDTVVNAVDALVVHWHGQGPVAIGGDPAHRLEIARRGARLVVERRVR